MKIDGLAKTRCPNSRTVAATPRYVPTEILIIGISQGGHEGFWQVYMICGLAGEDSIASLKLGGMQENAVKGARLIHSMRQCLDIDHGTTVSGTKLARVTEGQQSRHKTRVFVLPMFYTCVQVRTYSYCTSVSACKNHKQ